MFELSELMKQMSIEDVCKHWYASKNDQKWIEEYEGKDIREVLKLAIVKKDQNTILSILKSKNENLDR